MLPTFYLASLTETTNPGSVDFTDNLAWLDTIREASDVREKECEYFPTQLQPKVLRSQTTKISRFTSINERANLVPINHLLVNNLLLCRTNFINCDRSYVNGGVSIFGVAELRYDKWGQGTFWLPDVPRLSAIQMIRWIGNRNLPKLKIMNY